MKASTKRKRVDALLHRIYSKGDEMHTPPNNDLERVVAFLYTNHREERARRVVTPVEIVFRKMDPYYPMERWLLIAWDHDKDAWRYFDMAKIELWGKA